jgi:hypothetical protein
MDTYSDRISKFNDMVSTTNEHIKAIQDAATKFKDVNDPVGLGLTVTGAAAGGASGIAGSVAGIQHFKDFKTMYKGLASKLQSKGRQTKVIILMVVMLVIQTLLLIKVQMLLMVMHHNNLNQMPKQMLPNHKIMGQEVKM